jgi:dihydroorotate dehydrogenase electron transfer subunit
MAKCILRSMPVDRDAAVVANTRLSADYNVLSFAAPDIAALARPGQFVMVKTSHGSDPLLRRPFSIFEVLRDASGDATGVSILNKRVGVGTARLYEVEPGTHLPVLGPLGIPFEPVSPPADAWMVAGGVGLAPFLTLAEALRDAGIRMTLFYGARRASELYCLDTFTRLGVRIVLATEDGSRGSRGFVTAPLGEALADAGTDPALAPSAARATSERHQPPIKLYVCGPTPMMQAVARLAASHGRACDVSLEQTMGCGLGGCYSCVVLARSGAGAPHFIRSCIDGPVFDATRIVWEALAH